MQLGFEQKAGCEKCPRGRDGWVTVPGEFSSKIKEGFFKVVVALGRDLVVLQILLPVESHLLCLHLPVLDIDLVAT